MSFKMTTHCNVVGVHEHLRTISGRKDSLGQAVLSQVSLGWFIHLDLDEGGISFLYGPDRPPIEKGDIIKLTLEKVLR